MGSLDYVVITPARNEGEFIAKTIASMCAQTHLPTHWVIVNDGSTDATCDIARAATRDYPWVTIVSRPDRGFRKSGGGVVEAFYDGFARIADSDWGFVVKLDGDVSFEPDYFRKCLARFHKHPTLGIAGGTVYMSESNLLRVDSPGDPPFHVRGATKIYRRACWEQISPLVSGPGWDTVDEVKANMLGWATCSFDDIVIEHHRKTGAVDGNWGNWYKNGVGGYITGYHPAFMLAKCLKRMVSIPPFVAGIALLAGYCSGFLTGKAQVQDRAAVRYLRRQQLRRLLGMPSIYSGMRTELHRES